MALGLERLQRALEEGGRGRVRRLDVDGVGGRLSVGARAGLADEGEASVLEVPPLQERTARHQHATSLLAVPPLPPPCSPPPWSEAEARSAGEGSGGSRPGSSPTWLG